MAPHSFRTLCSLNLVLNLLFLHEEILPEIASFETNNNRFETRFIELREALFIYTRIYKKLVFHFFFVQNLKLQPNQNDP